MYLSIQPSQSLFLRPMIGIFEIKYIFPIIIGYLFPAIPQSCFFLARIDQGSSTILTVKRNKEAIFVSDNAVYRALVGGSDNGAGEAAVFLRIQFFRRVEDACRARSEKAEACPGVNRAGQCATADGTRTRTARRPGDFKSPASTIPPPRRGEGREIEAYLVAFDKEILLFRREKV